MTIDPFQKFAEASQKLRGMQAKWADYYLNDPEAAGNAEAAARKAKYSEKSFSTVHSWTPKAADLQKFDAGELDDIRRVTLVILLGLRCKAETARKSEMLRSETRAKLHITTDRVLRSILEIAERTAGYDIDDDGNRRGKFQAENFKPGTSQRSFELIGKDMGMFYDRGAAPPAKTFDQMDMAEVDAEIAKLDAQIAASKTAIDGAAKANAAPRKVLDVKTNQPRARGSKTKH